MDIGDEGNYSAFVVADGSHGSGRDPLVGQPFHELESSSGEENMADAINLERHGISVARVIRNPAPAVLYEEALRAEKGTAISSTGALVAMSGAKTGRSPKDKRIVDHADSRGDIWWGEVNIPMEERVFQINRERAIDYLNTQERLFVIDAFAGWDERHQLKIRVICERAYHALFMQNMLIRPTREQLATFGEPDFVIYNAGKFPANRYTSGMTSTTSIALSFEHREFVILGSEYAGEMKKGVFTIMNYLMPRKGVLSMHCSANEGAGGDLSLFFGLSGTGKTTLSADPRRRLIGDDEHCWTDTGVFNIEGGCYAKVINLSQKNEPEIWNAIRFGSVLENVVYDETSRVVNYDDASKAENTRASYPIEYIDNAKIPCIGPQPKNVIFLTCDAFGALPPLAKLTPAQAMYHYISGYTAKVAGTEVGVKEPSATFSACFGAPFLVWHPAKYAEMLAENMKRAGARAWLVNTGWTGGPYGIGKRISIPHTRALIDAIHSGSLDKVETRTDPMFGLEVPTSCGEVPPALLSPRDAWPDKSAYDAQLRKLGGLFAKNFEKYSSGASDEVRQAGPRV